MKTNQLKFWLLIGGVAVTLIVIAVFTMYRSGANDGETISTLSNEQYEQWRQSGMDDPALSEESQRIFGDVAANYDNLLEQARTGRVDLVVVLWELRRKCGDGMELDHCNMLILQYLKNSIAPPDNTAVVELFRKYLAYEETMMAYTMPSGISDAERHQLLMEKRRELLGLEATDLFFGFEAAQFDFAESFVEFRNSTANMPPEKRIAAYEDLRKKMYGQYYEALREKEPAFDTYTMEMELRSNSLASMSTAEQSAQTRAVRERYFGRDGADRMAAVDRQLADEQQREDTYRAAEADFLRQNAGLSESEKKQALSKLRVQILGAEEAEAYARREELAQASK